MKNLPAANRLQQKFAAPLKGAVCALCNALALKDFCTYAHSMRVSLLGRHLAQNITKDDGFAEKIAIAALLHDIGKIGVPDHILLKFDKMAGTESDVIDGHSLMGYNLLNGRDLFNDHETESLALDIARYHHEQWGGKGYPSGLKRDAIPLAARIIAIVDVFDALASKRPYKKALPPDKAFESMRHQLDNDFFDPSIFAIFENEFTELAAIHERSSTNFYA